MTNYTASNSPVNFQHIHGVVTDMDGVLWRDQDILPGVAELFQYLHQHGVPYVFATNNSTRAAEYYVQKISQIGIEVELSQIVSSGIATAAYLAQTYPPETSLFVVGETGLKTTLQAQGFTIIEDGAGAPQAVVVGLDRNIDYQKLLAAATYIRRGASFIATNPDKTFPIPGGLSPGAGSIVAAVEAASGTAPHLIIGKPGKPMFEIALQHLGTAPENTLMIGDRLDTDILGAAQVGMRTALVLTGVSSDKDIMAMMPDIVCADLTALLMNFRLSRGEKI